MRILRTTRDLPKETLTLQRKLSIDSGGRTVYDVPGVEIEANVVEYGPRGHEFIVESDGSRTLVTLTGYQVGDATNVPTSSDRLIRNGQNFIIRDRRAVRGLRFTPNENDHYRFLAVNE